MPLVGLEISSTWALVTWMKNWRVKNIQVWRIASISDEISETFRDLTNMKLYLTRSGDFVYISLKTFVDLRNNIMFETDILSLPG